MSDVDTTKSSLSSHVQVEKGKNSDNTITSDLAYRLSSRLLMNETSVKNTLKNARLCKRLDYILNEIDENKELSSQKASLIMYFCGNMKDQIWIPSNTNILLDYILLGLLDSKIKIDYALEYFIDNINNNFSKEQFETRIGLGVVIDEKTIRDSARKIIEKNSDKDLRMPKIIGLVFSELKFADRLQIKTIVEEEMKNHPNADNASKNNNDLNNIDNDNNDNNNNKKNIVDDKNKSSSSSSTSYYTYADLFEDSSKFHKVGQNHKTPGYIVNSENLDLIQQHLKRTKSRVITRFPPEPNGLLHIGHAKAIFLDFGFAAHHQGETNLRFDDTNPEKEELRFMVEIEEIIEWLGFAPNRITYASDYFDQIYEFALQMIRKGLAYVCHMSREEMKAAQDEARDSPYRERSVEENLKLFEEMKQGLFDESKATLRLKYVMPDGKRDLVAYRIKFMDHVRTGNKWCIYPSYDFTHPICDSLEDITHSMCSKEFQTHRPLYYWLCNALGIYCPVQWEFSRLNLIRTVISKRKIQKLIENQICSDWDDPRLYTLSALKRRGVTRNALYKFCESNSVTMAQSFISPVNLNHFIREDLNLTSPRAICILEPLEVEILNFEEFFTENANHKRSFEFYDFPHNLQNNNNDNNNNKQHCLTLKSTLFIDSKDFSLTSGGGGNKATNDSDDYRRLTPTQPVGLMYSDLQLKVLEYQQNEIARGEKSFKLIVKLEKIDINNKPRAYIQWLSDPLVVEIRMFSELFKHDFPEKEEYGGFLNDVNEESIRVLKNSFVEKRLAASEEGQRFQFVREGYFCVDKDSTEYRLVFNRTVALREDPKKLK